ncbi:MAG: O-antigen ligase family protein [Sphaerobacter sp.]|nr:O-antigen ligase family protein [Sphaerobacter sp.]
MAIRELVPFDRGPHPMRGARPLATLWPAQALLALLVALGVTAAAIVAAGRLGNPWAPLVVAALLAPFVALVFGHVRRVLLALVIITIPTGPDIFLGYRYDIGGLGGIGGWNVSVGSLALVGLYAIWLAAGLTGIGHAPRVLLRPALPLLAYLAVNLLSVIVAGEPILSLIELFWLLQLSLLFLYVASNATTRQEVLFVIAAIMGALVLESLIMIAVGVTGQTLEFAGISTRLTTTSVQAGGFTRVAGTVGSPNAAAAYVAFLLAPALGLAVSRVPNKLRWLGAIAFGLGTLALVLTLSRGGMLAFAISLLVFGLISLRRKWLTPSMAVAAIGIVTIVALVFRETLAGRLFGSDHGAAFARIPLMQIAFNIIADHPLGIGLNNSARILPTYVGPDLANAFIYSVHNY